MMKKTSIILMIIGVAITIACLVYFKPALNVVDSDAMTVNPHGTRTSEWPIFIGLLTIFVGITFYVVSIQSNKAKK
jgi:ABC-type nickel/cobalt efflux system permease component RcnA